MTRILLSTACAVLAAVCTASDQPIQHNMFNKDLLEKGSNAAGVSGFEDENRAVITAELEGCGTISHSRSGNLICEKKGPAGAPTIALIAHMDEIGRAHV